MRKSDWLGALCLWLAMAGAALGQAPERYSGTAQSPGEPPVPVHAEFTREGAELAGIFRVHGGEFKVVDGRTEGDRISGAIRGDGAEGKFALQVAGERAEGTFELGGGTGVLTLLRTQLGAAQTLAPAEQKLDLTPQQWREDLDQAVEILTTQHGSPFHRVSRSAFEAEAARIRAALPTMDGLQTAAALRRLGSMIGDGHTSIGLPRGQPRLPFEAFWFEDGLRIVRAPALHRDLLGGRITAVDGVPIGEVTDRLRAFLGQG